jgi:hypothetical protein
VYPLAYRSTDLEKRHHRVKSVGQLHSSILGSIWVVLEWSGRGASRLLLRVLMGGRVVSLRVACLALDSTSEPDVETLCWCPGREVLYLQTLGRNAKTVHFAIRAPDITNGTPWYLDQLSMNTSIRQQPPSYPACYRTKSRRARKSAAEVNAFPY